VFILSCLSALAQYRAKVLVQNTTNHTAVNVLSPEAYLDSLGTTDIIAQHLRGKLVRDRNTTLALLRFMAADHAHSPLLTARSILQPNIPTAPELDACDDSEDSECEERNQNTSRTHQERAGAAIDKAASIYVVAQQLKAQPTSAPHNPADDENRYRGMSV
jgi:hypothetical protein